MNKRAREREVSMKSSVHTSQESDMSETHSTEKKFAENSSENSLGILTQLGLYANGGMPHFYGACPKAVLLSRSGIGWVLLMGMMMDFIITAFGWWPVVSGFSVFIAMFWVGIMLTIDRAILRSMDGGSDRKTKKSALAMRLIAICLQVLINTGLTMMILMGNSTDKFGDDVYAARRQPLVEKITTVQNAHDEWVQARQAEIGSLVQSIAQKRDACNAEAMHGNNKVGRGAGYGSVTRLCLKSIMNEEADLAILRGQFEQSLETKQSSLNQTLQALNDEVSAVKSNQAVKDGLYGRIFTMLEAVDRMKAEQPVMVWVILIIDLFILVLQTSPFVMKLSHQSDEYDFLFAQEMWAKEKIRLEQSLAHAQSVEQKLHAEKQLKSIAEHEESLLQADRDKLLSAKVVETASIHEQALEAKLRLAKLENELHREREFGLNPNRKAYHEISEYVATEREIRKGAGSKITPLQAKKG